MLFQNKSVSRKSLSDPGRGGLPNPTGATMWGKGSWGARPPQSGSSQERRDRAGADRDPRVPTVSTAAWVQYW